MFMAMDVTSNFYYSYTYDLTQTLQHNQARPQHLQRERTD